MRRPAGWVAVVLATVLAGSAACGGGAAPGPAPTSATRPSSGPATAASTSAPAAPASPLTVAGLCPGGRTDDAVAGCVMASLNAFWSARLHRPVAGHVVLAIPATLPADCRYPAEQDEVHARTAFECPVNNTMYFGPVLLRNLRQDDPADGFPDRLAAVMGHEAGHLVQDVVRQQQPADVSPEAGSRFIEQQADCLSGAWAAGVGLDPAVFLAAARAMLADVDDPGHVLDHGTVDQRTAAVRRGLGGAAACRLRKP